MRPWQRNESEIKLYKLNSSISWAVLVMSTTTRWRQWWVGKRKVKTWQVPGSGGQSMYASLTMNRLERRRFLRLNVGVPVGVSNSRPSPNTALSCNDKVSMTTTGWLLLLASYGHLMLSPTGRTVPMAQGYWLGHVMWSIWHGCEANWITWFGF